MVVTGFPPTRFRFSTVATTTPARRPIVRPLPLANNSAQLGVGGQLTEQQGPSDYENAATV